MQLQRGKKTQQRDLEHGATVASNGPFAEAATGGEQQRGAEQGITESQQATKASRLLGPPARSQLCARSLHDQTAAAPWTKPQALRQQGGGRRTASPVRVRAAVAAVPVGVPVLRLLGGRGGGGEAGAGCDLLPQRGQLALRPVQPLLGVQPRLQLGPGVRGRRRPALLQNDRPALRQLQRRLGGSSRLLGLLQLGLRRLEGRQLASQAARLLLRRLERRLERALLALQRQRLLQR